MSVCVLDHIVLLLSTEEFENLPAWLGDNFTILNGGRHTGQASRNKLIVFSDGTYLELFNWYDTPPSQDDEKQPMRVWAEKKPGLIDVALSSMPPSTAEGYIGSVNQKLAAEDVGLGVKYQDPAPGGRRTADGIDIKWKVSRPIFSQGSNLPDKEYFAGARLDSPFFCHDVTDRELRVTYNDESRATHRCGARGINAVEVMVPKGKLSAYTELYSKIIGSPTQPISNETEVVEIPVGVPVGRARTAKFILRTPRDEEDVKRLKERGVGIFALELVRGADAHDEGEIMLGGDHIASTIRLV